MNIIDSALCSVKDISIRIYKYPYIVLLTFALIYFLHELCPKYFSYINFALFEMQIHCRNELYKGMADTSVLPKKQFTLVAYRM